MIKAMRTLNPTLLGWGSRAETNISQHHCSCIAPQNGPTEQHNDLINVVFESNESKLVFNATYYGKPITSLVMMARHCYGS